MTEIGRQGIAKRICASYRIYRREGVLLMPDPLLLLGTLMLGMALGALLTRIRYKSAVSRIVKAEIERHKEMQRRRGKPTDSASLRPPRSANNIGHSTPLGT